MQADVMTSTAGLAIGFFENSKHDSLTRRLAILLLSCCCCVLLLPSSMTIKNTTPTAPSSHCSTLSSTVTDYDTTTSAVSSRWTTVEEGQQVNPSFTHSIRTQEEELVETETPVDCYISISAHGPVDVPNGWEVHREVDKTIIRVRSFNAVLFGKNLCIGVVWTVGVVLFFVTTKLWWFLLVPFVPGIGLFSLYVAALYCLNSLCITIKEYYVVWDYRPLPSLTPRRTTRFTKSGYEEIRVWRRASRTDKKVHVWYDLHLWDARTESFTELPFKSSELDKALFLAQETQKYLNSRIGATAAASARPRRSRWSRVG